jgi:hypothetical protein
MKLYTFASPNNYNYAQAIRLGTWYPKDSKLCKECRVSQQMRVSPLIMEWEPGCTIVGDFVWPGLNSDLVVVQRVKEAFEIRYPEVTFGEVKFWQDPKIKQPKRKTRRSKPRIWLPYIGSTLWDVIPTHWCQLELEASGVEISKICSGCGKVIYKSKKVIYERPPFPQRHLVVDKSTWNGENIFHIKQFPGGIFCTDAVKQFVEQEGYTNVRFMEEGSLPE